MYNGIGSKQGMSTCKGLLSI